MGRLLGFITNHAKQDLIKKKKSTMQRSHLSIKIISKSIFPPFFPLKEPILQDDLAQNLLGVTLDIKSYCVGV